jgi:membrane-associated phospholipid phosphatase
MPVLTAGSLGAWLAGRPLASGAVVVLLAMLLGGLCWRASRTARRRRLILYRLFALAAGMALMLLALGVAGPGGGVVTFDHALAQGLAASVPASALAVLSLFTHLGDRNGLILLSFAVLAGLAWRRRWRVAATWALATGGAGLITLGLKAAFARLRPEYLQGFAVVDGFGFPSGHAAGAAAVYGMLACLLFRTAAPRWHLPVVLAGTGLISAIGVSRVLLRAHYASDVAAGWLVAVLWLAACLACCGWWRRSPSTPGAETSPYSKNPM